MTEAEKDYNLYLEKYCILYGCTREEAELHQVVKDVKAFYEETSREEHSL